MAKYPYPKDYGIYNQPGFYTSGSTSASTMDVYYGNAAYYNGGVSDRERYYREMAQQLQEEVRHMKRMMPSPYAAVDMPLAPAKPKEPDNLTWLRKRVDEITAEGKLAA